MGPIQNSVKRHLIAVTTKPVLVAVLLTVAVTRLGAQSFRWVEIYRDSARVTSIDISRLEVEGDERTAWLRTLFRRPQRAPNDSLYRSLYAHWRVDCRSLRLLDGSVMLYGQPVGDMPNMVWTSRGADMGGELSTEDGRIAGNGISAICRAEKAL
jgi:hypothetical protein